MSEGFFHPYAVGIAYASVYTDLSDEEAAGRLNQAHPTGVGPWTVSEDTAFSGGESNPYPCPNGNGRRHILFNC